MATIYATSAPTAPPPPVRINAHAPLGRIIDALAAAGWGTLRTAPQSVRSVLLALGRIADPRTGVAETTDAQIAERAGLHPRTVARARTWLVDHGLVTVLRRGARHGHTGIASLLSLTKTTLISLLPAARATKDARERERASRAGGARRVPSRAGRRPFPPLGEKTAGPRRWGVRPGPSPVQDMLRREAVEASASPPRASTIAAARAAIAAARARMGSGTR